MQQLKNVSVNQVTVHRSDYPTTQISIYGTNSINVKISVTKLEEKLNIIIIHCTVDNRAPERDFDFLALSISIDNN